MTPDEKPKGKACLVIAARVSAEMHRKRMTVRRLAVLAGVDERTVRNILDAKDTKLTTLDAIAAALETEVVALLQEPAA